MPNFKRYLLAIGVLLGLVLLAAVAAAGPGGLPDQAADKASEATARHDHEGQDPDATPEADIENGDASDGENHGHCVSWAAHQAASDGVEGRDRGTLISAVAQNEDAISTKVEEGSEPSAACRSAYDEAASAVDAEAAAESNASDAGSNASDAGETRGRSAEGKAKNPNDDSGS